jgi:Fur family ferric uptake transcriptional regulator
MKVKVKNMKKASKINELKYAKSKSNSAALDRFYRCRTKQGLKFSSKRIAIIEYFINADRHFTVEQLYNEIKKIHPKIGYSTVYRTLKLLTKCGMANVHHFGETDAKFEVVHKKQHHDHLVCQTCGRIIEFTHTGIEEFQKEVARKHNFLVHNHELQIYGVCDRCQKKLSRKKRAT